MDYMHVRFIASKEPYKEEPFRSPKEIKRFVEIFLANHLATIEKLKEISSRIVSGDTDFESIITYQLIVGYELGISDGVWKAYEVSEALLSRR
ncbi:hypothetical protein LIER_25276 [Lithospermum erythrorhizon]|uniref:Uncharacterized protein n=1 Tax=Lithospermum erythrorhizon TaxID=34254 RepID=A0AAV3R766_LITER